MEKRQELEQALKRLKMPGVWNALEMRLAEARESKLGHLEFLSLLIQDELASREDSMFAMRMKAAGFGVEKTFQEFDYHFNEKALPPATVRDLASCHFVEQRQNLVIGGPPGIGKSHVVKAIGHEACRRGYHVLFRTTQRLLGELLADSAEHAERMLHQAVGVDLLLLGRFRLSQARPEGSRNAATWWPKSAWARHPLRSLQTDPLRTGMPSSRIPLSGERCWTAWSPRPSSSSAPPATRIAKRSWATPRALQPRPPRRLKNDDSAFDGCLRSKTLLVVGRYCIFRKPAVSGYPPAKNRHGTSQAVGVPLRSRSQSRRPDASSWKCRNRPSTMTPSSPPRRGFRRYV